MAINTYATLKTAVGTHLNRSDLTSYIPDFITLGTSRMFYGGGQPYESPPVRIPAMQGQDTGTVSAGYIAFPADFLEPIKISASSGTAVWQLDYQPLSMFGDEESTDPSWYTYRDNAIYTGISGSATYTLDYYQSFTLSGDADTNWILTNAPQVYLYAALMESAPFLVDDPRIQVWYGLYRSAVIGINKATQKQTGSMAVRMK